MKNILLIDDHNLIYQGLKRQLSDDLEIFYAANTAEAKEIVHSHQIDIAVIDISVGRENGFDIAPDIKPFVKKIFFLTMHKSQIYVTKAMHEGYDGYFLKDEPLDLMEEAFSHPDNKKFWMTDLVASVLESAGANKSELYDKLSPREQQILRMTAEGAGYRDIGSKLNISAKTVNVHRANAMRKINVESQIELVKYALKIGIIEID
ncbi:MULTISPECIES: response regulator transcription factor [unclassified Oceanispirochaeta]|uniref:LuxR C-terminal-related transcriptional regulator n=1 Tax=unclassified Oceanispirochaeta TaxID=2635722 RepID=UPI000E09AC34|nr:MULTISPECIES: response regulator transcription factor [unclassified Oceanispirochaeta]MBF9014400.1 response regulator transcription factor [Oceanispirochaeta sp. M2]NPD71286.1 response regulator transcription factor [Oceanispirochaeta sp. M1]RDG33667.1 DNA-binding response regulator [Oceanispirochaeta sp. M1]